MADLDALARELVEAGMLWLDGMRTSDDRRLCEDGCSIDECADTICIGSGEYVSGGLVAFEAGKRWPDLTDWPTIGALVGELSRRGRPALIQGAGSWWVDLVKDDGVIRSFRGATPGEAVGRALLAVLRGVPRG